MTYIFALRPVTDERLLPQLDAVLEQRPELLEHGQLPKLWRAVDGLDIQLSVPEATLRRRRLRYRALGVLLLVMSFFLFVPDFLAHQPLSGSMLVGVGAFIWGIFALLGQARQPKKEVPETSAQRLLCDLGSPGRKGVHAIFSEDALAVETPDGDRDTIAYAAMERALETEELLVLADASRVVTLQKSELSWGEWEDFRAFLAEKVEVRAVPHER